MPISWYSENPVCPGCGEENLHIVGVGIIGRDERMISIIDEPVTMPTPHWKPGDGERTRVVLIGYCENGCSVTIGFANHEGYTYIRTSTDKDDR